MNDKLIPLPNEDFEQWLKRTEASNLSGISKVAYLFIALEKVEAAREALGCIAVDSTGWILRVAEDALAQIGSGQPGLNTLIEAARRHVMSDEEKRTQRVSFVYGNLKLDGCDVSREDIAAAMDKLDAGQKKQNHDSHESLNDEINEECR